MTHSSFYHQYTQLFLETRYPGHKLWTVNAKRLAETRAELAQTPAEMKHSYEIVAAQI